MPFLSESEHNSMTEVQTHLLQCCSPASQLQHHRDFPKISIGKAWSAFKGSMTIWKSDLSDKIKQEFFQDVAVLVQLHGYTD